MKKKSSIYMLVAIIAVLCITVAVVQMWRGNLGADSQKAADAAKAQSQTRPPDNIVPMPGTPGPSNKKYQDPDARAALALVGADPVSEQYWVVAINNPDLPAKERQDLIEDLNEEGISDPKNPTPEDLQVIKNRIKTIEQLSPLAMDDVNAAAFKEAYKDLTEMLSRANR